MNIVLNYAYKWIASSLTLESINLTLDVIFVVAMVWLLIHEGRSEFARFVNTSTYFGSIGSNGWFRTNRMINRLMVLTVNSGLVTMISALLVIIFVRFISKTAGVDLNKSSADKSISNHLHIHLVSLSHYSSILQLGPCKSKLSWIYTRELWSSVFSCWPSSSNNEARVCRTSFITSEFRPLKISPDVVYLFVLRSHEIMRINSRYLGASK